MEGTKKDVSARVLKYMIEHARLGDGRLVLESSMGDLWIARKLDLRKDPI